MTSELDLLSAGHERSNVDAIRILRRDDAPASIESLEDMGKDAFPDSVLTIARPEGDLCHTPKHVHDRDIAGQQSDGVTLIVDFGPCE
jgi:hypothetical protein